MVQIFEFQILLVNPLYQCSIWPSFVFNSFAKNIDLYGEGAFAKKKIFKIHQLTRL